MPKSTKSTPSPPQGLTAKPDDSRLPEGFCRYLLPQSELRGQRCGCVHFTLNRNIPSATCVCGHQSCFHTNEPHVPQLEHLTRMLETLQSKLDEQHGQNMELVARLSAVEEGVVARISALEEVVEKSRDETSLEIKGSYQNLSRAWQSIGELERQSNEHQLRLRRHSEQADSLQDNVRRIENRQLELSDADISLEERIEALEEPDEASSPVRRRGPSVPVTAAPSRPSVDSTHFPRTLTTASAMPPPSSLWTVHISLLPEATRPFPFERDTNAYKRCLSRGLHQTVVINGHDAEAFNSAVSKAFASLLKGRPWMPLQAQLCNAETLQGLPMLRRLDESMLHGRYDAEFLRRHCGVCDANGKIDSLYIAMRYDTLSWHALRQAPVFLQGLDSCWAFDPDLDPSNPDEDDDAEIDDNDRPSAGAILPPSLSLKRGASEMSRSSSFGSAAAAAAATTTSEGEGSRHKVARVVPNLAENRRRVGTV